MTAIRLAGSRILVTGASSGIGRALAKRLAERGAMLAVTARRKDLLDDVADEISAAGGIRPVVFVSDLSVRGAAAELARDALEALSEIDVLINNAGGGVGGTIAGIGDRDEGREAFEINYWSPLALAAAIVPQMRARRSGVVVNVTSGAQVIQWPLFGGYAATKAAFASATRNMQMELQGTGVRVVEVIPGAVDTAVQGETRLAPGIDKLLRALPMGDADVLAQRIVQTLERGDDRLVYPKAVEVGLTIPRVARWRGSRLWRKLWPTLDSPTTEAMHEIVIRTGTYGDPIVQEARRNWEARSRA